MHIRNNGSDDDPDAPGTPGWELIHPVAEGEPVVDKTTPDSFAGTDLDRHLEPGAALVVVGMQSDYCVRVTTLEALRRGHPVTLVHGAHATYDDGKPAARSRRRSRISWLRPGPLSRARATSCSSHWRADVGASDAAQVVGDRDHLCGVEAVGRIERDAIGHVAETLLQLRGDLDGVAGH